MRESSLTNPQSGQRFDMIVLLTRQFLQCFLRGSSYAQKNLSERLFKVAPVTGNKSAQGHGCKSDITIARVIELCSKVKIKVLHREIYTLKLFYRMNCNKN